jgi:hypothetical protein
VNEVARLQIVHEWQAGNALKRAQGSNVKEQGRVLDVLIQDFNTR